VAVDHPVVAVADGPRPQLSRIGPRDFGLGHREERARLARDQRRQESFLLLGRAVEVQDLAVPGIRRLAPEDQLGVRGAADHLVQVRVGEEALAGAARLGWEVRRPQPFVARAGTKLLQQRVIRVEAALVRVDVLVHECAVALARLEDFC